jgi:hypothetical protein
MDHALTRRGLLAGMGVAAGAAALGTGIGPAGAAGAARAVAGSGGLAPDVDPTLIAGLTYRMVDGVAFTPRDFDNAWPRQVDNLGVDLTAGGALVASLDLPVGSILKQVTLYYLSPAGGNLQKANLQRKPVAGTYDDAAQPATLAKGPNLQSFTWDLTEPVTGAATYSVLVNTFDTTQLVGGLRYGYIPPAQAFTPLAEITRVLDTRTTGGKLAPNEERTISLGVPGVASAAVFNLTVTETEGAGYVAVFPAGIQWPGNSTINWSAANQNLANGVISAIDGTGKVIIRGGTNKTHVVIDVQGYLM